MRGHCVCVIVIVHSMICRAAPQQERNQNYQRSKSFSVMHGQPKASTLPNITAGDTRVPFYRNHDHIHQHDHKHNHVHGQNSNLPKNNDTYDLNGYSHYVTQKSVNFNGNHDRLQDNYTDATMVFPSYKIDNSTLNNTWRSSKCDFGICEEVDNYPEEKIKRFITNSQILKQYFEMPLVPFSFDNRFGEEGESLCRTRVHTVFPRRAKNVKKEDKMLVNIEEYKQGVVFETCVKDGEESKLAGYFREGFVTTCKQKYAVRRLMAVSDEVDKPVFDDFQMPSCCVCYIHKT